MVVVGFIKQGVYFDSVTLMVVAQQLRGQEHVLDAAVVMGTAGNQAILNASGLVVPEFAGAEDTDLLIAVKAATEAVAAEALAVADELLAKAHLQVASPSAELQPLSLEGALQQVPEANLALISVAGHYAGHEARRALEHGLHVLLFSDNVPLETEISLKELARAKGLLLMGPDCGTAIINGVPLAFANAVRRGPIGIVAASGTGLQEISSLVSNQGSGISQAIGTGSRDVQAEVGGIMFLVALEALAADEQTRVIVLVAKRPDTEVLARIETEIAKITKMAEIAKPVVTVFLGAESYGPWAVTTLWEAALRAVALAESADPAEVTQLLAGREAEIVTQAKQLAARRDPHRKYLRGLMSGGTFAAEAQVLLSDLIPGMYTNTPAGKATRLPDSLQSQAHTIVDLGADEFTVGRPHPMIDYSLRKQRLLVEANDPETAVILLDVVLGYGAHPDPAAELVSLVRDACQHVAVVCSVTGTDRDPQNRSQVVQALTSAGAIVMPSNAEASLLAGHIVRHLGAC